jgi:hypothetical protein
VGEAVTTPHPLSRRDRALSRASWIVPSLLLLALVASVPVQLNDGQAVAASWRAALADVVPYVGILAFPVTGSLILLRQPRNTVGWLLQAIGAVWAVGALTDVYARYGLLVRPGSSAVPSGPRPSVSWGPS